MHRRPSDYGLECREEHGIEERAAGRVFHIEMRELCIQYRVAEGELTIVKGQGESNLAVISTKHVDRSKLDEHI